MGSFAQDVTKFVQKTGIRMDLVLRKVAFDGLAGVILRTPVDTGRCRGNWRVAINRVDKTTTWNLKDKASQKTLFNGNNTMKQAVWGDAIYITNNLPYAKPLEDGHSKQVGKGHMLAATIMELRINLKKAVDAVS